MVKYPRPSENELPELYEVLDELQREIEVVLREQFNVVEKNGGEIVVFTDASTEEYLDAIWTNSEVMVPFFQKITGLPGREFERQYGVTNIERLRGRKTDFRDEEDAIEFAEALEDLLPAELYLETLLYAFVKLWENDQRRHFRARYENSVRKKLNENGYRNFKGNTLAGEPDLVIPQNEPYEVTGEVRVVQQRDRKKRSKEFGSEARAAKVHFPEAKFVVVVNFGEYIDTIDRDELREDIDESSAAEIDGIFFHDELGDLVDQLEKWDVTRDDEMSQ